MTAFEFFKPKPKTEVLPRRTQEEITEADQLNKKLDAVREREAQRQREYDLEQAEDELRWAKKKLLEKTGRDDETDYRQHGHAVEIVKSREILPRLRPASVEDYKGWLRGFFQQGGEVTHVYNYKMSGEFYVATKDFTMFPFYGSDAIQIIVPKGVKFLGGELGHCNLYFEDGYRVKGGTGWVPLYKDVKF